MATGARFGLFASGTSCHHRRVRVARFVSVAGGCAVAAAALVGCGDDTTVGSDESDLVTHVIRFAAIGDTGTGSNDQRRVGAALADICEGYGCDFVLLLGDNIYESGVTSPDDPQLQSKFEVPYARVEAPFYAVLGNHDYGDEGWGEDADRARAQVEYTEYSDKWQMPAEYYKFNHEHAAFFAVDTNTQRFGTGEAQREEVAGWVNASRATWKIAFGHHPYLSNGDHGNAGAYDESEDPRDSGTYVKDFFDEVLCGRVDLYLSGHDHSLQWLDRTCDGTELAVSGAGARIGDLPGRNGSRFEAAELGFLYVVIQGKKLTAEFIDADRTVLYTRRFSLP
jgi:tartrate-resistant acid phosphatase type 5